MKTLRLIFGLILGAASLGRAQDRIVLLRDTARLGVSPAELEKRFPPALARVEGQQGVFARRGNLFFDSLGADNQRFGRYVEAAKRRLPVPGVLLQTDEFVQPDGTYAWVFCQFSGAELTDEQEGRLLQLVAEWYGRHPFPIKTPTGFRSQRFTVLGALPEPRTVRRGPGIVSTLDEAARTNRPDTVKTLALNQLSLLTVPEVVYRFTNLEELDLSKNALNELPARLTADLPRLERLSLLYNVIPDDSLFFAPNTHLRALNVQGNRLTRVPPTLVLNQRLESLWLGHNQLNGLNVSVLRRLRRLSDLNLYSAGLTQLPAGIGKLKRLTVLDLYYNQLTQLPRQVGRLKRLEQLAVAHNNLSELPPKLARLRRLQRLFVHHNRISQLPVTLAKLRSLQTLDLGYNWFTVPPAVLASLPALEELDLNNNNLQEFPDVLSRMKRLRKVYLGSNPLFGREALTSPYARQIEQLQANHTEVFY